MYWQPVVWWRVGLEFEGLELKSGANRGFSQGQWWSLTWLGADQGPRGWSHSSELVPLLLRVMVVYTLAGSSATAEQPVVGGWCRLGACWGGPGRLARAPICCLCAGTQSKQVCMHVLQEQSLGFLQPSGKPQPRRFILPREDP